MRVSGTIQFSKYTKRINRSKNKTSTLSIDTQSSKIVITLEVVKYLLPYPMVCKTHFKLNMGIIMRILYGA